MNNFLRLNSKFQSLDSVRKFLYSQEHTWNNIGYGFDVLLVPPNVITDPVIENLVKEFNVRPNIFRTPPRFWYKWHLDAGRTAALNIEISSEHSHTVFGEDAEHDNKKNIEELVYEQENMYLLNTQTAHSVLNLGSTRYMLGLGFRLPYTYATVRDYCINNNL